MTTATHTDNYRYEVYLHENKGWQNMLRLQKKELPELEKLLADIVYDTDSPRAEHDARCVAHFHDRFIILGEEIQTLEYGIEEQQTRLVADCCALPEYDIDAVQVQDILREKIKVTGQHFAELKSDFMAYLSAQI